MAVKKKQGSAKKASRQKTVVKKKQAVGEPAEQVAVRVIKSTPPETTDQLEKSELAGVVTAAKVESPEESDPNDDVESPARAKKAKKLAISTFVLLVILLAGGVVYTWYMDQGGSQQAAKVHTSEQPAAVAIKPTAPSADTQESAAVEFLSSPVAPGGSASINVKTVATSTCTISVTYNSVPANSSDLGPQTADDFGNVNWSWTVPAGAPTGTWPVKVTCVRGAKSAVVQDNLVIARQ